jgi:hypothetical protein
MLNVETRLATTISLNCQEKKLHFYKILQPSRWCLKPVFLEEKKY